MVRGVLGPRSKAEQGALQLGVRAIWFSPIVVERKETESLVGVLYLELHIWLTRHAAESGLETWLYPSSSRLWKGSDTARLTHANSVSFPSLITMSLVHYIFLGSNTKIVEVRSLFYTVWSPPLKNRLRNQRSSQLMTAWCSDLRLEAQVTTQPSHFYLVIFVP